MSGRSWKGIKMKTNWPNITAIDAKMYEGKLSSVDVMDDCWRMTGGINLPFH